MSVSLKTGVSIRGLRPEAVFAALAVHAAFLELAPGKLTMITSGTEADHGERSFHYNGLALDFMTHHLTRVQLAELVQRLQEGIGSVLLPYDVVLEDEGQPNEHLHVEFDDGHEAARTRAERVPF